MLQCSHNDFWLYFLVDVPLHTKQEGPWVVPAKTRTVCRQYTNNDKHTVNIFVKPSKSQAQLVYTLHFPFLFCLWSNGQSTYPPSSSVKKRKWGSSPTSNSLRNPSQLFSLFFTIYACRSSSLTGEDCLRPFRLAYIGSAISSFLLLSSISFCRVSKQVKHLKLWVTCYYFLK